MKQESLRKMDRKWAIITRDNNGGVITEKNKIKGIWGQYIMQQFDGERNKQDMGEEEEEYLQKTLDGNYIARPKFLTQCLQIDQPYVPPSKNSTKICLEQYARNVRSR